MAPTVTMRLGEGPDAATMEFQSPEDAARFYRELRADSRRPLMEPQARLYPPSVAHSQTFETPMPPKPPARMVFKNGHYAAFKGLWSTQDGLTSEQVTNLLGSDNPKSLPPTVAAWGKRARAIGLDLSELLEVDRGYEHGKPSTIYRLTPKGREVFGQDSEPARTLLDSSRSEVG